MSDVPAVLRDMPMGTQGTRGRLLWVTPDDSGNYRFVFYRGCTMGARAAVAGCPVDELRDLFDRRQDVERRQGKSTDLDYAVGLALDIPTADPDVRRIIDYLAATA